MKKLAILILLLITFCATPCKLYADTPWYVIPLKIHIRDSKVINVLGIFYMDKIIGKNEKGEPVTIYFDYDSFQSIVKKNENSIILNNSSDAAKIYNVSLFFNDNGLKYIKEYILDKDGYTYWVTKENFGFLSLENLLKIERSGHTEHHPIVEGKPEDLLIGKGLYNLIIDEYGAIELQSMNKEITTTELKNIRPLLTYIEGGLSDNFPTIGIYNFKDPYMLREDYIKFVREAINDFKKIIQKLKNYDVISFFHIYKAAILENYTLRLKFAEIVYEWLKDDDFLKFKTEILAFYSDDKIKSIIKSIENTESFREKYKLINFELYNHLNRTKFPTDNIDNVKKDVFKKYKLRIVDDPRFIY